jgi:glyoxylase-like metal-dependent hydrolase (beta-lactamase superfamily II)
MFLKSPPFPITQSLWAFGTTDYPIYLFQDEFEAALFEGGVGSTTPLLVEQVESVGMRLATIGRLAITHAHPDHVMGIPQLRALLPDLCVIASEKAAQTLAAEKAVSVFAQMDELLHVSLSRKGAVRPEHIPPPLADKRIAVDRVVGDGDSIAVGGSRFQVLATPGHSECSLSFYEPREKILIISDASGYYMPSDASWWPTYLSGYGAYLRSLERLAAIEAEVLCLSHNAIIRGVSNTRAYLEGAMAAARQYHARIVAETRAGRSVRQIAECLGAEVYAKTDLMPLDFFQKNCGVLVKQSLKHEGLSKTE